MSENLYFDIGVYMGAFTALLFAISMMGYLKYICTEKIPLVSEYRLFGMKTLLIYDDDIDDDIGATVVINILFSMIASMSMIFIWLPAIIIGVPWIIVYNTRKRLFSE